MLLGFVDQSEAISEEVVLQLMIGTRIGTAEPQAQSAGGSNFRQDVAELS